MAPKAKETTVEERKIIVRMRKEGRRYQEISDLTGRALSTIHGIVRKYDEEGTLKNRPRSGRPRKLSDRDDRTILRMVRKDPFISATSIASEISRITHCSISARTIRYRLREAGYRASVARRKPFVSEINITRRLEFSTEHVSKPLEYWKNVLFCDESKFNLWRSNTRKLVWRKRNTALDRINIQPTVKHTVHVMVWGCMNYYGCGRLVFIDGIMNKHKYLDILKNNLVASAADLSLPQDFYLYQDNDSKHRANIVSQWLREQGIIDIKTPAQSPDLNPIENLWELIKRKISERRISSKEELRTCLQEEWNCVTIDLTQRLVSSMPARLQNVLNSRGLPTKY